MRSSPYGQIPGWDLLSVVVKSGIDIRQERLACQLIQMIQEIWREEDVDCWASPHHNVLVVSTEGGLIEAIPNTISVHSIKKASFVKGNRSICSLREFFVERFGNPTQKIFKDALMNFIQSLAGYSLITYVLQLKDRHNGNILVDKEGHIVHIDFGFMLSNAPGGSYMGGIETAPFKLTSDYIELLGNMNADAPEFIMFRGLFMSGFLAIRKHYERLMTIIECSMPYSSLPCLGGRETVLTQLKARLLLASTDRYVEQCVDRLITSSAYNLFTRLYDSYQYYSNGIL
jgi:phosphatidylinositol 4-kinase